MSLSSHVLDTTLGKPVAKLPVTLTTPDGQSCQAVTNDDGRITDWACDISQSGVYHLRFATQDYLKQTHGASFYPFVDIHFELNASNGHYHVPLLLSPYGFSSYRGS